jgi:hypothetical protein
LLQSAWRSWAVVLGLQREGRAIVVPGTAPPKLLEVNSAEATANSQAFSDSELTLAGFRILIPEIKRISMLADSLGTTRFAYHIERFYELPSADRTLRTLVEVIEAREISKPGQLARALELESNNTLTKNESSNAKSALLANDESPMRYPLGSCIFHPTSVTHTTNQCRGQGKAGNEKKTYRKAFEERHCSNCDQFNPNRTAQNTHNLETCSFKPPKNAKNYKVNLAANENSNETSSSKKKKKSNNSTSSNENDLSEAQFYAMLTKKFGNFDKSSNSKSGKKD